MFETHHLSLQEEEQARLRGWFLLIVFGVLFVPAYTFFSGSSIRFMVYALPGISIFFWLITSGGTKRFLTDTRFVGALMLYAALPLIGSFMQVETIDRTTWINAFRPIFYLAAFIPFMLFSDRSVKALILIFALATMALWFTGSGTTRGEIDLGDSKGLLESGLAFPLGAVFIYCVLRGQKFWGFFAFILFFIAFKRIAIGAAFLVLGMIVFNRLISRYFPKLTEYRLALGIFFLIVGLTTLLNLYYFEFFTLLSHILDTQHSVNHLTMGRLEEFNILYQQYGDQELANLLLGNGPGDATRKLVEITISYPLQVHNSFLLYFYDFGVIGFSLFMIAFFIVFSRSTFGVYLMIYNVIIMVTDNTFSHHYHQITYFILMIAMQYEKNREVITLQRKRDANAIS